MHTPPGFGQPFKPGGYIDPVAENISLLHHDVADIHADAELHAAIRFEGAGLTRARSFWMSIAH